MAPLSQAPAKAGQNKLLQPPATTDSDDEWEEDEADDCCSHDLTLDINEPHSHSGRYWKEEFERYQREARAEMGKLLKYKQLAKSYAQQKDAEAIQLTERLRDEQQKVIRMERKIADKASQIVSSSRQSQPSDQPSDDFISKLTKQTALAAEYRHRVQDLEEELKALLEQREAEAGADPALDASERRRRRRRQTTASPTTHKTLLETQRELRRARSQLREVDSLRREVDSLKARVKVAESQAADDRPPPSATAAIRDLKAQLRQAREDCLAREDEVRRLKKDVETIRKENAIHEEDSREVLERAHTKISQLKKEVKVLRAAGPVSSGIQSRPDKDSLEGRAAAGKKRRSADHDGRESNLDRAWSLRDKFKLDAGAAPEAKAQQPSRDKHEWQPSMHGTTPAYKAQEGDKGARDLDGDIDLLRDRFARLDAPDAKHRGGERRSSSNGKLPPERRAAALARIEQRMAEKKRAQRRTSHDKENVRP